MKRGFRSREFYNLCLLTFLVLFSRGSSAGANDSDHCSAMVSLLAGQLANCLSLAEARFTTTGDEAEYIMQRAVCTRRHARNNSVVHEGLGGYHCPPVSADAVQRFTEDYTHAVTRAALGGDFAAAPDICTPSAQVTTLNIHNHCLDPKTIAVAVQSFGRVYPSCLQSIEPRAMATAYLPKGYNYSFFAGDWNNTTLFEIDVARPRGHSDWFDISFNQGFDVGMAIIAPPGTQIPYIVATDSRAPGAYPIRAYQACWAQPCISPNYPAPTGGTWDLYLCALPQSESLPKYINTPGPCGCDRCPCQCNWTRVTCKGQPIPNNNGCPKHCP